MVEAPVAELLPNPHQPRRSIDPQGIGELASSIEQHGLLQPIVVRRREEDDRYEVVAGERRWRAFQHLGKESIPAILTTGDAEELALIENLQREDLHPLDEAIALHRLKERHGYTHETLAKSVGRSRSVITETLQLNTLPTELQEEARRYPVTRNALVQMVRIADRHQRKAAWEAIKQGASMRQIRAQRIKQSDASSEPADRIITFANKLLRDLEAPSEENRASLSAEQGREVLLRLRARIDALLGT
jgi:ParB family chromosome partitioning protein